MANLFARISIPTVKGSVLSMCGRTARLGGVIGATGLFGAHVLSTQPLFVKSQCQGGVAPRHQFTQSDVSLQRSRAPIDFQQLSSGSVLGIITGYLTAKIGRLFLFSFGGLILFGAFLRYQGYLPSPWPFLKRTLHVDTDDIEGNELSAFLKKNTTFKASFVATFMIGLLYS